MQSGLSIPLDVIQIVIDELHQTQAGDKALKACALVSHAFSRIAQRHLFSTIFLLSRKHFETFFQLLSETPHISSYVRTLAINDCGQSGAYTRHHVALTFIISATSPNLRTFVFHNHGGPHPFNFLPDDLKAALLELFASPNLTTFETSGLHILPFTYLARNTQFKHLKISLCNGYGQRENMLDYAVPFRLPAGRAPCNWESLEVNCDGCARLISNRIRLSALRALHIGTIVSFGVFRALLIDAQRSLEHLRWISSPSYLTGNSSEPPHPSLLNGIESIDLTNLKSLTLQDAFSSWKLALLASLLDGGDLMIPRALESITLLLTYGGPSINDHAWDRFEIALTRPRYSKLKRLTIRISSGEPLSMPAGEGDHPFFRQMPSLHSSGILDFGWNKWHAIDV